MDNRQEQILRLFESYGFWSVIDLAKTLDVSPMTVRRDLSALEKRGLVRRHHGGAVALHTVNSEPLYRDRANVAVDVKKRIAEIASNLIRDNQVIAIDCGSTCFELAKNIKNKRITVITTNFRVIAECINHDNIQVIVPPGILRSHEGSITGADTVAFLSKLHTDIFFMGIGGLDINAGLTDYNIDDVAVKKVFISNSSRLVVLADKSKINRITFAYICGIEKIDDLVTEENVPSAVSELIYRSGGHIITSENREDL